MEENMTNTHTQMLAEDYTKFPQVVNPKTLGVTGKHTYIKEGIHYLIMLDRYSQRDNTLETLKVGDTVVAEVISHPKYPTQAYGTVKAIDTVEQKVHNKVVKTKKITVSIQHPQSLDINGVTLTKEDLENFVVDSSKVYKPLEVYWEQICARVAKGVASVEKTEELQKEYEDKFYWMIKNLYAIPGGRILYGAGSDTGVTLFNCFVLPPINDSRKGINDHRGTTMEIMSHGGGNGSDITPLRPKWSPVYGVNGHSSGAVSWGDDLSSLTNLVIQGGSRRGAQMISMMDWHPDIIQFILCKIQNPYVLDKIIKETENSVIREVAESLIVYDEQGKPKEVRDKNFMTGANISVLVTDDLMNAVKNNADWDLKFPDLEVLTQEQKVYYDKNWGTIRDVRKWEKEGLPTKVYTTLKASDLWDLINTAARYSAEPGVIFIDTCEKEANSYYYSTLVTTNPCGEQPLPPYAVCNLIAINSKAMYSPELEDVDYELLEKVVRLSQRFGDNVIDHTPYFLEKNEEMALGERRIGKGLLGFGDLMIKLKLAYGSEEMLAKTEEITKFIMQKSYQESSLIAKEKGSFPYYEEEAYLNSGFVKRLDEETLAMIKENGIRNVCSITEAPTGSTGTMVGVSTGIEPNFAFTYYRSGRLGQFIQVNTEIAQEYYDENPDSTELPEYYVSAMDLTPLEHIRVQAVIQKYCDSAISKTCNAPSTFTVEDNKTLYMEAWESGCKGVTVYVDGSRDSQVLTLTTEENTFTSMEEDKEDAIDASVELSAEDTEDLEMMDSRVCEIRFVDGQMIKEC